MPKFNMTIVRNTVHMMNVVVDAPSKEDIADMMESVDDYIDSLNWPENLTPLIHQLQTGIWELEAETYYVATINED